MKKLLKTPPAWVTIQAYGIWSKSDKKIIFINLDLEEVELEYDMEGYEEDTHVIVCLDGKYDVSSLEPSSP